jgi:hypothetical protein
MDLPENFGIHGHESILRMLMSRCTPVLCCTSADLGNLLDLPPRLGSRLAEHGDRR